MKWNSRYILRFLIVILVFLNACSLDPGQEHYERGIEAYNSGDYRQAAKDFYEALENNDLNAHIEKLGELNGEKKEYQVIIPFKVNSISQKETAIQLLKKHFEIMKKDEFSPFLSDWQWKEELYACKTYFATDYYKAIGIGNKDFSTDKEIFAMWQNTSEAIRENVKIGCMAQGTFRKIDIRQADYKKSFVGVS